MERTKDAATPPAGQDTLALLRAPFMPAAVRFKIQTGGGTKSEPKGGTVICYIDARLVVERLNMVAGLDWHDEYEIFQGYTVCRLTVHGVTRQDAGMPGTGLDGNTPKAMISDALKRAGVKFGIGVSIYATPRRFAEPSQIKYGGTQGKPQGLTDAAVRQFRELYRGWLDAEGITAFGQPIDHGDTEDAVGDHEVTAEAGEEAQAATQRRTEHAEADDAKAATPAMRRQLFGAGAGSPVIAVEGRVDEAKLHDLVAWVTRDDEAGPVGSLTALTRGQLRRVLKVVERTKAESDVAGRVAAAVDEWLQTRPAPPPELPYEEDPAEAAEDVPFVDGYGG